METRYELDYKDIKPGKKYYLVISQGDYCYESGVIVPVTVIKKLRSDCDAFVVEQNIDGFKRRLECMAEWLSPFNIESAKALVFNQSQREKRIGRNGWRFCLTTKTAKVEIMKALVKLKKQDQKRFWAEVQKVYPALIKNKTDLFASKLRQVHWEEMAWAIICMELPLKTLVEVEPWQRKKIKINVNNADIG